MTFQNPTQQTSPSNPEFGIHHWIHENNLVTERMQPLTFQDHLFLFEPYADFSPLQVYKKCSQVGVSVMMNIKCPYVLKTMGLNIIYTLPSDRDIIEFVPTKTDKIIVNNPAIREGLNKDKNTTFLKDMWGADWHFKGTRSKTAPIMTTADLLIHDEKDRSDNTIIEDYRSRIKKSEYKGIWELSNPSTKNVGVDLTYKLSDKKEWAVKCPNPSCQKEQIMDWNKNVDRHAQMYVCMHCGHELDDITRRLGRWIQTGEDSDISGYHISQMMASWISAKELLIEEAQTDEDYFYNFVLGEAVGTGDAENFRQYITDAWTPKDLRKAGPHFMGIDIGNVKHYVVGNLDGIHTIGKVKTREEVELLIEHWNPTVVMDAGPERTWAGEFRKKYPKFYANSYRNDTDKRDFIHWGENDKLGTVSSERYRVIDATVDAIIRASIQFSLDPKDLEAYIRHWEVMVKTKEIDGRTGLPKFSWNKNSQHAQDHWCHATVYYYIARSMGTPAEHISSKETEEKKEFVQATPEGGFKMRSLEDYFEEHNM